MSPRGGAHSREGPHKLLRPSKSVVLNLIILVELPICRSPAQDIAGMSVTNVVRSESLSQRALAEMGNPSTVRD